MIDIYWNRIVMSRRCGSQRARSDQIHHDQDNALYATEVPPDFYQPKAREVVKLFQSAKLEFRPGLLRGYGYRRFASFRTRQALTIYGTDFSIDRVCDLSGRKSEPSLIGMSAPHPRIRILKNLVFHLDLRRVQSFKRLLALSDIDVKSNANTT